MPEIKERAFEDAIVSVLTTGRMDSASDERSRESSPSFGEFIPGGYRQRDAADYNRELCLIPEDVLDFILATQPKGWTRLKEHYGAEVKDRFLRRLSREIGRRGTIDVLRKGIKDAGCKFQVAYFRPASKLNPDLQTLYRANVFTVIRQLHYSTSCERSLDLALFLNGIPLFTAEVKNPLNGQTVEDAIKQYKEDRDPREPLLAVSYTHLRAHET